MLSVNCMLNNERDSCFYDAMHKPLTPPPPPPPPPRSSMLNITSLLCHDEDEDDVPTTPCLSAPSSPVHRSKNLKLPPPFINLDPINHRYSLPDSPSFSSMPSSPLTPPLRHPCSSSLTSLSSFDGIDNDALSKKTLPNKQQQPFIGYHYHHRLLMMLPQENEQMQDRKIDLMNNSTSDNPVSNSSFEEEEEEEEEDITHQNRIKNKRRRATKKQLQVLHRVFEHTFFPSTQVRAQLGQQIGMNPRTVQIWFQNRRQALRTKEKQKTRRS